MNFINKNKRQALIGRLRRNDLVILTTTTTIIQSLAVLLYVRLLHIGVQSSIYSDDVSGSLDQFPSQAMRCGVLYNLWPDRSCLLHCDLKAAWSVHIDLFVRLTSVIPRSFLLVSCRKLTGSSAWTLTVFFSRLCTYNSIITGPPTHSVGGQYCFALYRLSLSVTIHGYAM